tara:strand:- start:108 stop:407 length:300 start_codon:yes stop_codon:yes gene_type:complete
MESVSVKIIGNSMWPHYKDGQVVDFNRYNGEPIQVGDIIVFNHPFRNEMLLVKRVSTISENSFFVEGDNPDPTSSTDSHNFGSIDISSIIAFRHNHITE